MRNVSERYALRCRIINAVKNNSEHTPEDSYPAELLKTREGQYIEGINTVNGIPEELYPAFVRLVRALGMEDE